MLIFMERSCWAIFVIGITVHIVVGLNMLRTRMLVHLSTAACWRTRIHLWAVYAPSPVIVIAMFDTISLAELSCSGGNWESFRASCLVDVGKDYFRLPLSPFVEVFVVHIHQGQVGQKIIDKELQGKHHDPEIPTHLARVVLREVNPVVMLH